MQMNSRKNKNFAKEETRMLGILKKRYATSLVFIKCELK
jgi:hypothetical protein